MYNKSNINQYIFRVERVSGLLLLKQVNIIGLHNFNNECTEADAFSDLHDNCHFSVYYI